MDRIARGGMRFTDAHSPSAVCTPTRYGLLTGRYCWRGRLKRSVLMGFSPALIEPGRLTMASMLRQKGYATACIGKWHLGLDWMQKDGNRVKGGGPRDGSVIDFSVPALGGPIDHGFDRFFGCAACPTTDWIYAFLEGRHTIGTPTEKRSRSGSPRGLAHILDVTSRPAVATPGWRHEDVDLAFVREAVGWLDDHATRSPNKPFFLYLPLSAPHAPWLPPRLTAGTTIEGPRGDMVALVDWAVGKIDRTLRRLGRTEDTLLVVTSDNGPRIGQSGHRSAGPWRGYKSHTWEGGHRIPLMVRWPGVVEANTVNHTPVQLNDLFATVASVVGYPLPDDAAEDSLDMLPTLLGESHVPREAVVSHSVRGAFTIRQGRWKLILGTRGSGGWVPPSDNTPTRDWAVGQLFDLESDPGERRDLFASRPEVVKALRETLQGYVDNGRTRPRSEDTP
ncbi:MAG: arylsulfatase [Planctomycetes bacterium]|nr:arylsulfatase [Planctomycetota bacterium]